MTPFEAIERELKRHHGAILRHGPVGYKVEHGSHSVDFEGPTALDDAAAYGRGLPPPQDPVGRRRRLSMHPRAVMKRKKRQHWKKMVAAIQRGRML